LSFEEQEARIQSAQNLGLPQSSKSTLGEVEKLFGNLQQLFRSVRISLSLDLAPMILDINHLQQRRPYTVRFIGAE
jgi:hypothetical protein